jgi:hypothetical protein
MVLPSQSLAIVVRGDAPIDAILADPDDYPEVVSLLNGRAVGTLISETWILTAAHVGQFIDQAENGNQVTIGGEANSIAEIVIHPSWDDEALGEAEVFDIALLRLTDPVLSVSPAPIYRGRKELNAVLSIFGWGRTGDGQNETLIRDGVFRRGENLVDAVIPRLRFRFDEPNSDLSLPLEAVSGPGDSGGPAFVEVDGTRFLAGVSSFQEDISAPGIFGVTENYERISDHIDWIERNFEPIK